MGCLGAGNGHNGKHQKSQKGEVNKKLHPHLKTAVDGRAPNLTALQLGREERGGRESRGHL